MEKWFILLCVILAICIFEWIREISTFKITHYNITSDKLKELKKPRNILFLTDLHNNSYGKDNVKLLQAIREQNPDMILIGGDMLVGEKGRSFEVAISFITKLVAICPVYCANGNHEQRMKLFPDLYGEGYVEYLERLQKAGVQFLQNEHADLTWDDISVQIHGLEIPYINYHKFKKTTLSESQLREILGESDQSHYQILLAHNPVYMETYKKWGADLVLCGHLHGGIVRIPRIGGVISPQFRLFPRHSGELTKEGKQSMVVSKGLGTHTIKIRFLNMAEVIVLHMQ